MTSTTAQPATGTVRVLVVDDHAGVRSALRAAFTVTEGLELCGAAASGAEGVELALRLRPDVVVMDVAMPGMDGLAAVAELRAHDPYVPVVMLSAERSLDAVMVAATLGVSGFVRKGDGWTLLLRRVREAAGRG